MHLLRFVPYFGHVIEVFSGHKAYIIRSNIGSAMNLEILHLNKLYVRYYKEVSHDTCGPTSSQSWSCIRLFKKHFILWKSWGMTKMGIRNGCPYVTTRGHGEFRHRNSLRNEIETK
jgi:hypothetical protein